VAEGLPQCTKPSTNKPPPTLAEVVNHASHPRQDELPKASLARWLDELDETAAGRS